MAAFADSHSIANASRVHNDYKGRIGLRDVYVLSARCIQGEDLHITFATQHMLLHWCRAYNANLPVCLRMDAAFKVNRRKFSTKSYQGAIRISELIRGENHDRSGNFMKNTLKLPYNTCFVHAGPIARKKQANLGKVETIKKGTKEEYYYMFHKFVCRIGDADTEEQAEFLQSKLVETVEWLL